MSSKSLQSNPIYRPETTHLYYFSRQHPTHSPHEDWVPPTTTMYYPPPNHHMVSFQQYPLCYQEYGRKQIKRQTAGIMIGSVMNRQKYSSAQSRPQILVPPRGIGPVYALNPNDVLCGRGGRINSHPGNVQFREMVQLRKKDYLAKTTKKLQKAHIADEVVKRIRGMTPSGRFLKEDSDGAWYDIGDKKAIKKVGQALREDASEVRQELDQVSAPNQTQKTAARGTRPAKANQGQCAPKQVTPPTSKPIVLSEISLLKFNEDSPYEPLALQDTVPFPAYPEAAFNHEGHSSSFLPGVLPSCGGAGISSAAAAVMQEKERDDSFEIAFGGRTFHPPEGVEVQPEVSNISGLSGGPSSDIMSGVSLLSEHSGGQPIRTNHQDSHPQHGSLLQGSAMSGTGKMVGQQLGAQGASMRLDSSAHQLADCAEQPSPGDLTSVTSMSLCDSIFSGLSISESFHALDLAVQ